MTTPPNGPSTEAPPDDGPRVTGEQMRDLSRLRRSASDRHIAGVAGGIARHLDIDPLIVRVAFVVMVLFGGGGLLLYGGCWLLIPDERDRRAIIPLDHRSRVVALWLVVGAAVLTVTSNSLGSWHFPWQLPLIAVGVVVIGSRRGWRWHHRYDGPPRPSAPVEPVGAPVGAPVTPAGAAEYPAYRPPVAPDPRRRGPVLFGFTLALAILGIGVLITADLAGAHIPPSAYPAVVAGSCGVMLLVSAWFGRGGGLIPVGLVAALAMAVASTSGSWHVGRFVERPQTAAQIPAHYRMGVGELEVDLTRLNAGELRSLDGRTLDLEGRAGHILVIVPEDGLDVDANATIHAAGDTELFGVDHHGDSTGEHGDADEPHLTIDAELVFGQIEFRTEDVR